MKDRFIGEKFVAKCKCKGYDFIPCFPSLTSINKVTKIEDGDRVIYCGSKEIEGEYLYGFYILDKQETNKDATAVWVGETMAQYIIILPTERKYLRRKKGGWR